MGLLDAMRAARFQKSAPYLGVPLTYHTTLVSSIRYCIVLYLHAHVDSLYTNTERFPPPPSPQCSYEDGTHDHEYTPSLPATIDYAHTYTPKSTSPRLLRFHIQACINSACRTTCISRRRGKGAGAGSTGHPTLL